MSWLWSSSDKSSDPTKDPLRDLDPSLRDFLKKESPVKYEPTLSEPKEPAAPATAPRPETDEHGNLPPVKEPPMVFKDGRYKHLWATYQPQSTVEASVKSDAEKIADVLEGYKYRKAEIGRAALENCAFEQEDVNRCFASGGLRQRLTMCKVSYPPYTHSMRRSKWKRTLPNKVTGRKPQTRALRNNATTLP